MRLLIILNLLLLSCQTKTVEKETNLHLENLNRYLEQISLESPLNFGKLNLGIGTPKELIVDVNDVYSYSFKNLQAKDQKRNLEKPAWLIKANARGLQFQQIFEITQSHLTEIVDLLKSPAAYEKMAGLSCCSPEQKTQLKEIFKILNQKVSNQEPDSYKSSDEYLIATLHWIVK